MIYQGQEQHFSGGGVPVNREALWTSEYDIYAPLYNFTAKVNMLRKQAIRIDRDYLENELYVLTSADGYATFRKGYENRHIVAVYTIHGEEEPYRDIRIPRAGRRRLEMTEITTCTNYTLDDWGALTVTMHKGLPKIFFPADQMGGSKLCGVGDWPPAGTAKAGNGSSPNDSQDWEKTDTKPNDKWGRRPGRKGTRPIYKKKKPPRPKESGTKRARDQATVRLLALALGVFYMG